MTVVTVHADTYREATRAARATYGRLVITAKFLGGGTWRVVLSPVAA